ncbi:guanine nucleotide exchange factor in Golgi transport N-terminal-domain-containing protein [Naematelia encephala]|uniref:Guanine nucleotide exchange factor in Golgi transport N-terminal-domain-containing protein n=1 Tax=Naematelia encephala TaxID=71784 RepID=A0A1Y2B4J1_9TREE|nr:guanine nucleotide exchange factor in Golgi transport N-terminal-domain-containing protein [Naematelia encephala]
MDQNLLVSELQSLVIESKRRHTEVKDAGERALEVLRGGALDKEALSQHASTLLEPVTLGCKTKVAKIVGISIAALQRVVALGAVPTTSLPGILHTLNSVASQGVDIQLRLLQTLLSILTFNRDVHDEVLGNALLLCFKLQESRVSVVSSTAAATLRQAVMIVFDRITSDTTPPSIPLHLPTEPPTELVVTASVLDAFNIFSDLCLLTAGGGSGSGLSLWGSGEKPKPKLLKLSSLQRTFGLELIESILSGYEEAVKKRPELLFLLRKSLDPLLLKLQAEKPSFPIALRVCRLIFLLIRSFAEQLPHEVENYLTTLIRMGMGDGEADEGGKKDGVASWLRVLALEILRGICGDSTLLQSIWQQYDQGEGLGLFGKLVATLGRLVNEKPALLGIGSQMHGLGLPHNSTDGLLGKDAGYLDMGIEMMTSAANVGVATVSSMIGSSGAGLGVHSGLKLRLIEQHDKAEAPIVPDTYVYLLALQSLNSVAEAIFAAAAQNSEPSPAVRGMASSAWPALLAALSYLINTNLSDSLFAEVLSALQDFTIACGLLDLVTPRDAFLNTLGRYAAPPTLVSAMQSYLEAPTPRGNSGIGAEALALTALGVGASTGPPAMSDRNLACLKSMVLVARLLAGSLGQAWHDVLEVLQNANFLLATKRKELPRRSTMQSPRHVSSPSKDRQHGETEETRPDALSDLDTDSIQAAINSLFDGTRDLSDEAFNIFISALTRLSSEMIGLDTVGSAVVDISEPATPPTPSKLFSPSDSTRRRTSGLNISHSIKSGERSYSLTKLRVVSILNLSRLVTRDPQVGWTAITTHLLAVARHISAPSTIRIQASDALGELLISALRVGKESRIQHQVFDVLVHQVDVHPISQTVATDYDVRSSGYQTLNQILESSGHSLEVGWQTIFGMLDSVCKDPAFTNLENSEVPVSQASNGRPTGHLSKGDANLVRIAFPSLNLICTDFLSSLDNDAMQTCITCLGCFGRQREDVNIALASIGLLWNVSDAVQADSKELWLYLLLQMLDLGRDSRLEVRSSAMQTLFRCIELYGSNLSAQLWEDVLWKVVFPLLDAARGDEGSVLALTSVGSIFHLFLSTISDLPSFEKIYQQFLNRVKFAFISEPRPCTTAALKALEKVLSASSSSASDHVFSATWITFNEMAAAVPTTEPPLTQDNLIAFVRVASLLHAQLSSYDPEQARQLSAILRSVMTYSRSPEYRPDVDVMSPLQTLITELVASSTKLGPSIVLSDLAGFASLAYMGVGDGASGKLTYVAVSKYCMAKIGEVFLREGDKVELYEDRSIENVIAAYAIPIKLKYDCPAPSKYGDDPPLWKTAMSTFVPILIHIISALDTFCELLPLFWVRGRTDRLAIPSERFEGIWTQLMDIFSGTLSADGSPSSTDDADLDESFTLPLLSKVQTFLVPRLEDARVPDRVIESYAEILRKASSLYHHDVRSNGGTTAPVIGEISEKTRYWAFDLLTESVAAPEGASKAKRVARLCSGALIRRWEEALKGFVADAKLRGQMPFSRLREDELLYILRHLVTVRIAPGSITKHQSAALLSMVYETSSRPHLFHLYPLLLELSFLSTPLPSMWMFPSEQARLFGLVLPAAEMNGNGSGSENGEEEQVNAGDGGDLIEVNARDLVRRCLVLVGEEMGVGIDRC